MRWHYFAVNSRLTSRLKCNVSLLAGHWPVATLEVKPLET
jgi:hypothetical protein